MTLAWHFTGAALRDGRPLPAIGETLRHEGELVPCESGLHASELMLDALGYAPGAIVHRVRLGGVIIPHEGDKLCASERTILWSFDATETLRAFARAQALSVIHLWNAPDVVRRYLETGDEALRAAAVAAAWAAASAAARAAARAALAARDAARAAASAAESAAARAAAMAAERDAARAAASAAESAAARAALAARDAARDAAWAAGNKQLTTMICRAADARRRGWKRVMTTWEDEHDLG